uniref:Uncharacterized protein n=1 Tax=Ciona savignyi TaxID=51511 RepID=H2Z469_CIOSA
RPIVNVHTIISLNHNKIVPQSHCQVHTEQRYSFSFGGKRETNLYKKGFIKYSVTTDVYLMEQT